MKVFLVELHTLHVGGGAILDTVVLYVSTFIVTLHADIDGEAV
jgi:hypothetical protein